MSLSRGLTRLLSALHSEIIDHYAEVGVCAREHKRWALYSCKAGIDACEDSLSCSFLVSGCA